MITIQSIHPKVPYFFLRGKVRWPFIHSNPKIVFFFSENAEKKNRLIFCLFQKISENFSVFFFCSRKSSLAIHSFDFKTVFFLPGAGKKKQHFHSFIRFSPKSAQKRTFPGKKIRYLLVNRAFYYFFLRFCHYVFFLLEG